VKAVVYHGPGDLRIENVNDPVLNEGDALLKVLYSGLCGTDVKTYRRGHHMFTPPCILGHEVVGRIEAIEGRLARPDIAVGDLGGCCSICALLQLCPLSQRQGGALH